MNDSHNNTKFIIEKLKFGVLLIFVGAMVTSIVTSYFFNKLNNFDLNDDFSSAINISKIKTIKTLDIDKVLKYSSSTSELTSEELETRIIDYAIDKNFVIIDLDHNKIYGTEDISHDLSYKLDQKKY